MRRFTLLAVCLLLAGTLTLCGAASPSIGMVVAPGSFQIDHARVSGDATLFEGTVVQTGHTAGDLQLNTGIRMRLASDSQGRVFRDHLVLERGAGQLNGGGYRIEARTLRISAGEPYASAKVSISGTTRVQVAALTGSLRVTNARGLLVANLLPGAALEFEPQVETDSVFSRLTGTVRKQAGKYFLTDETTNITVELRGAGLDAQVGKRVEINGSVDPAATPAQPATQIVRIQSVSRLAKGAAVAGGAAGAAAGTASAAGATAAGVSAGTIAIVGGVAAAGTVTGLGIAGSLPGQNDSTQNSSR